jgi:membrane-bound ClpP family serine protease
LSGIAIALIPKCPYCILAYSSAITMCSGRKIYSHSPDWTSFLLLGLALLTLLLILFNYKGKRTITAAILVATGSALMFLSQFYTFSIYLYYLGTLLLLFGVWVNANFRFFYRTWIKPLFYNK